MGVTFLTFKLPVITGRVRSPESDREDTAISAASHSYYISNVFRVPIRIRDQGPEARSNIDF